MPIYTHTSRMFQPPPSRLNPLTTYYLPVVMSTNRPTNQPADRLVTACPLACSPARLRTRTTELMFIRISSWHVGSYGESCLVFRIFLSNRLDIIRFFPLPSLSPLRPLSFYIYIFFHFIPRSYLIPSKIFNRWVHK